MEIRILKEKLKYFIEPHPEFIGTEEKIYTPKKGINIKFWFEGDLQIEGFHINLEINYNDPDLLVLALRGKDEERIIRVSFERLIAFELIPNHDIESGLSDLLRIGHERKN